MKRLKADQGIWASAIAAGAAMALCFALKGTAMAPLECLPRNPPPAAAEAAEEGGGLVNINTAGPEELMSLPGIGEVRAQAIIEDREANGPFDYPEHLTRVKGIGEGTLAKIMDQITTGGDDDAQNISG